MEESWIPEGKESKCALLKFLSVRFCGSSKTVSDGAGRLRCIKYTIQWSLGGTPVIRVSGVFSDLITTAHSLREGNALVFMGPPAQVFDVTGKGGKQNPRVHLVTRYFLVICFLPISLKGSIREWKKGRKIPAFQEMSLQAGLSRLKTMSPHTL